MANYALKSDLDNIGLYYNYTSEAVSIPSGSGGGTVCSLNLPAGRYILKGSANFATNATGARKLRISDTASYSNDRGGSAAGPACPNGVTMMETINLINVSKTTTYYLCAEQYSGSALNVSGQIRALRFR